MGKRSKRRRLELPDVKDWVPYQPFSKNKEEILKKFDEASEAVDVPEGWKEPKFNPEDNPNGKLYAQSTFSTLFPKYREKYLREVWPAVVKILKEHHIKAELDLGEATMEVHTTPKTFDPFIILKARDLIRLLARSVPLDIAARVLEDEVFADIIEIKLRNRERFVKRRSRLIGDEGNTLKAIELATNCYVMVQGKTVAAVGPYDGLKKVRQVVNDCIYDNIHPAYYIKRFVIIQKLMADPTKKNVSWDKYLPRIKKKTLSRRRKPHKIRKKPEYTPFPPPQQPSKVDIELEKGTYFLAESERKKAKRASKVENSEETSKKRQLEKRAVAYIPPE
uniref:KRR1 small subunit processome component n=1 Tax=Schistocephalus solidus TaxID=70667 RepID=A0A0X3PTW3_SCHSO